MHLLQRGEYQPRRFINEQDLQELAASIEKHGVMQPIVIRPIDNEKHPYEIIAGERRWRAAQLAGLTQVPAIVRDLTDQVAIALALIENIQRQDLNPIDQAMALQRFQRLPAPCLLYPMQRHSRGPHRLPYRAITPASVSTWPLGISSMRIAPTSPISS